MSKSSSNFDGVPFPIKRSQAEAEGIWSGRESAISDIRDSLLEDIDLEEYIGRTETPESGSSSPRASLIKSSGTQVPDEGSKVRRKTLSRASQTSVVVTDTEWTMLRMLSALGEGFDLEVWWRLSNMSNRLTAIVTLTLLIISISNFVLGIALIVQSIKANGTQPYVCNTPTCHNASMRIKKYMNPNIDPCDNFYEFMCGGDHLEKGEEGDILSELITRPSLTVELGKMNILGKIMRFYRNESRKDQHITFYRSCLRYDTREKYGLVALRESIQTWFGTKDFKTFQKSMEEIAANIFTDVGHASFINMAFYTYPFILILEPHPYTMDYRFAKDDKNKVFLETLFGKLMLRLELLSDDDLSKEIVQDMVTGTDVMSTVVYEMLSGVKKLKDIPKDASLDNLPKGISDIVDGKLAGLCPPMGVRLDYFKVLELFLQEDDYKVEYLSPTVRKYVLGLRACFQKDPGQFTKHTIKHPRPAFVAIWIADVFLHDFILGADYKNISENWKLKEIGEDNELVKELSSMAILSDEYLCLDMLWTALGYLPTIRFLESDPNERAHEHLKQIDELGKEFFRFIQYYFEIIPNSKIDWRFLRLGENTFKREVHSELGFPLIGGIVDYKIGMELEFTDDFLNNTLIGFRYTISRARHNWLGSTDPRPFIKYFGSGGPGNIKRDLLVPRYLRVDSARLAERELAARNDEWERFLGRKQHHHIRFPMTLLDQLQLDILQVLLPKLSLKHAFASVPMYQGLMSVINDFYSDEKYPSLTWEELCGKPDDLSDQLSLEHCEFLDAPLNSTNETRLNPTMIASNSSHYSWHNRKLFWPVFAAKLAYVDYLEDRKEMDEVNYTYDMKAKVKHYASYKQLGSGLEKYTEPQLFFMGYARQVCRESWKLAKHTEEERQRHYSLEATVLTTLMQMDEFSEAWNCGKKTLMNNKGQPRCFPN